MTVTGIDVLLNKELNLGAFYWIPDMSLTLHSGMTALTSSCLCKQASMLKPETWIPDKPPAFRNDGGEYGLSGMTKNERVFGMT